MVVADFTMQDASLDLSPSFSPYLTRNDWNPANQSFTFQSPEGNGPPVTIRITATARPIPEDQIFVGLIASLALIYDKNLPPAGNIPDGGFEITFLAGLRHAIFLEPLSGQRINWAATDATMKALGLTVYNKGTDTEILFEVEVNSRRVARGGITNKPRMVISNLPGNSDQDKSLDGRRLGG
ncbi:MAG: hypothetical protein Q9163_002572 [Psora crenata]